MESRRRGFLRKTRARVSSPEPSSGARQDILRELSRSCQQAASGFDGGPSLTLDLDLRDETSPSPDLAYEALLGMADSRIGAEDQWARCRRQGHGVFTLTNPASARSLFAMQERGLSVLPGALFSLPLTGFHRRAEVLAYGFDPGQFEAMRGMAHLDAFLDYCRNADLPVVLSRPFHIREGEAPPPLIWHAHMALRFDLFQVLHTGTDLRQCRLATRWAQSLTPERLKTLSAETGVPTDRFVRRPMVRGTVGGSADRSGLLSGMMWTRVALAPHQPPSPQAALDGLRSGRVAPGASFLGPKPEPITHEDTLGAVLLHRLCELALEARDPGLLGTLFSQASVLDRGAALVLANLFGELRRHRFTRFFFKGLRAAFHGKRPSALIRWLTPGTLRPYIQAVDRLALSRSLEAPAARLALSRLLPDLVAHTNQLLARRVYKSLSRLEKAEAAGDLPPESELLGAVEIPAHLRALLTEVPVAGLGPAAAVRKVRLQFEGGLGKAFDDFSFPVIASALLGGLSFWACRCLTRLRVQHDGFCREWGLPLDAPRILWVTDTFHDHNGVSRFLTSLHQEAVARSLPIDFLICSSSRGSERQLTVIRPFCEFHLAKYQDQIIRLPNLLDAHRLFAEGAYDRVVTSTEFPMGGLALYFKHAFHVPAHIVMHTDWLDFAEKTLKLGPESMGRGLALFRLIYKQFDGVFVLNREHQAWLTGPAMTLDETRVHKTAHWADSFFVPGPDQREKVYGAAPDAPVLLFAGRISREKGVFELPETFRKIKAQHARAQMVFAGTGPALEELKGAFPEAKFLGWVNPTDLPALYASADALLMPSRFDTFGCVVLEALSCGLPVVAYNSKGPGDIVENGVSGYLVEDAPAMAEACLDLLANGEKTKAFKAAAVARSRLYTAENIIGGLLKDLGA